MERCKKLLRMLFFLPAWAVFLIAVPCFALVLCVLVSGHPSPVMQVSSYILSAYALMITVTWVVRFAIVVSNDRASIPVVRWANENPLASRLMTDRVYRKKAKVLFSLLVNLAYVCLKLAMGVLSRSMWFTLFAAYYFVMLTMRFFLFRYMLRHQSEADQLCELRLSRLCGWLLLMLNQALIFIVMMVVYLNRGYVYPGVLIYAMAAYSFYAIISAVIRLVSRAKRNTPLQTMLGVISLTSAMVSIFSLETAMLTQFGQASDPAFRQIMTAVTGTIICLCVLLLAIGTIVRTTKALGAASQELKGMNGK